MKNLKLFGQLLTLMIGFLFFVGCQQEDIATPIEERGGTSGATSTTTVASAPNILMNGVSPDNQLYTYRTSSPPALISRTPITGLRDGENVLAIDMRVADKTIYGVTNMDAVYTIDASGAATLISQEAFKPGLEGDAVGFDFNQTTDRLSIITNSGQNLKIDPNTGQVVAVDTPLNVPMVGSAFAGSTLFDIDVNRGLLMKQNPVTSELTMVGPTNLVIRGDGGFDVSSGGWGLAVYLSSVAGANSPTVPAGMSREAWRLYTINLKTGEARSLGEVLPMVGIAAQ